MYSHFQIPHLPIENYELDKEVVQLIPEEMARCHKVIGIDHMQGAGTLKIMTVGMVNPENKTAREILENKLGCRVIPFQIDLEKWAEAVNQCYLGEENENSK